jgi:hypothetical protein
MTNILFPYPLNTIISGSIENGDCTTAIVQDDDDTLRIEEWHRSSMDGTWHIQHSSALERDAACKLGVIIECWPADNMAAFGKEAEELRRGIEKVISGLNGFTTETDMAMEIAEELQKLLDEVDARDSLAYVSSQPASKL